ncbi:MAG: MFS transporter [Rhodobacter sp.]|uniref:MFS transporter n=1 Tax=Pararhodobacter sp. TaxID=2127056 RepID=UPI001E0F7EB4|nr:MFS transporter [Pararhodobacter sp.]MCB1346445.1 MFS transporter [Paracoccaceae bacterium]MCC0071818.1 MFS transporter [Rhodobacter sp.]HPD93491.1 MFS transporter [Pararhodobacter sp.]
MADQTAAPAPAPAKDIIATHYAVLVSIALCHFINDVMQSVLSASYPLLHDEFALSFTQIGLMTLAFMGTASVLQPLVGTLTDRHPFPQSLTIGMGSTMLGLLLLAHAPSYPFLLAGASLIGIGSAVFHPEASRVARVAAGRRFGTAQSTFQVGGNLGSAAGPLLAAFIVVPSGRGSVAWFAALALLGMVILSQVGRWHANHRRTGKRAVVFKDHGLPRHRIVLTIGLLAFLVFTKNAYMASLGSYYTFFLIEKFHLTTQQSQGMLFLFLASAAAGVIFGGPIGDRIGTRAVIWVSILGVLPFTLALPYVNLFWTGVLTVFIGLILSSAFPAIVVFAQELVPGRVGLIAGLFFGMAFGIGGLAAAALGLLADAHGIEFVYRMCGFLPALGILAAFLPRLQRIEA